MNRMKKWWDVTLHTLNKVGWQPELRTPPKYLEKDLLYLASKIGCTHVGRWGNETLSPSSGQPCFPEAIGEGRQKELCPFREGWKIKWCKSNG